MTSTTTVGPSALLGEPRDRRAERYAARALLWRESGIPRVRGCGSGSVLPGGLVAVKASGLGAERAAGFGGLTHCGSVWACPVCASKIAGERRDEIASCVRAWQARGGSVVFLTLTNRHRKADGLVSLWDAVTTAWGKVTSGSGWKSDKSRWGVAGWVRLVEVTHGRNGWHVHVHALLFVSADARWDPKHLGRRMFGRWTASLPASMTPSEAVGLDVRVLGGDVSVLGAYFAKAVYRGSADDGDADRLALEIARGDLKDARRGNRTPFRVLRDVELRGEAGDLAVWHEWEKGSHGRKQMTWSAGLRVALLAEPERTDAEIADADDLGGEALVYVDRHSWKSARYLAPEMLAVAESDDTGDNLRAWLRFHGFSWLEPTAVLDAAAGEVWRTGVGGRFTPSPR